MGHNQILHKLIKTTITTQNQGYAIMIVVDIGKYIAKWSEVNDCSAGICYTGHKEKHIIND